jgi:hypothetical protein
MDLASAMLQRNAAVAAVSCSCIVLVNAHDSTFLYSL